VNIGKEEKGTSLFRVKVEHLPQLTEYELSIQDLYNQLQVLALEKLYLWDRKYWYVSLEDWGKVFADVLLNMPKYTADKFDCEDFALLTTAKVNERYKLNTCGIAIGDSPQGYHGFNIFVSEAGLYYLEPQNGMMYPVTEDSGYKAEIAIMG
jgi:hypothetical protein